MLSRSYLYNAWFQHNLVGYGCPPQAMWRSRPLHIHTQAPLYWNLHITEANEPSAWNDRLQTHQLLCLLTCNPSGTMAVSLTGTASLTLPTKSQLTAWMSWTQECHWGKAPWGGFSSHSDWPLIEVIVTWTIRVKTTPPQPV